MFKEFVDINIFQIVYQLRFISSNHTDAFLKKLGFVKINNNYKKLKVIPIKTLLKQKNLKKSSIKKVFFLSR